MIDVFCMLLRLHRTINKSKIVMSKVSNIKPFMDLYDWKSVKYPTVR